MACEVCGGPLPVRRRGRPAVYCSQACRARAYRARRSAGAPMGEREAARLAAWEAAQVVEAALAEGRLGLDRYGADRPRVETALGALTAELRRRAGRASARRAEAPRPVPVEQDAAAPPLQRDEIAEPVTKTRRAARPTRAAASAAGGSRRRPPAVC